MSHRLVHPPVRPIDIAISLALLALLTLAANAPALASPAAEHGAEKPATAAAPAHAAPPLAAPAAKPVKPVAAESAAAADPIDHLQRRLAETLGANRTPESRTPYDMQVKTHAVAAPAQRVAMNTPARAAAIDPHAPGKGAPAHAAHWTYGGESGPQAWAEMSPDNAKCATGERQSPIDIRGGLQLDLEPVQFEYQSSGFNVLDNGHTVQVNVGTGNAIRVLGRRYELVQFHFHRPSEERIDGRAFDMVVHLVHKDMDGRLAVVAVLLDRGSAQPIVQTIWNNLPLEKGEEVPARSTIDLKQLLPEDRRYYTYMGSLTTPPCSEGVLWMVMKQPVQISPAQIAVFSRLYPMNARPVQSAAGRLIKESN